MQRPSRSNRTENHNQTQGHGKRDPSVSTLIPQMCGDSNKPHASKCDSHTHSQKSNDMSPNARREDSTGITQTLQEHQYCEGVNNNHSARSRCPRYCFLTARDWRMWFHRCHGCLALLMYGLYIAASTMRMRDWRCSGAAANMQRVRKCATRSLRGAERAAIAQASAEGGGVRGDVARLHALHAHAEYSESMAPDATCYER